MTWIIFLQIFVLLGNLRLVADSACVGVDCGPVDGGWSLWIRHRAYNCTSSCKRKVILGRSCSEPAPSGGGAHCVGKAVRIYQENCIGHSDCTVVDGVWSDFMWTYDGPCEKGCIQKSVYKRTCDNPAPSGGGAVCQGNNTRIVPITCTNLDDCKNTDGQWSEWFREVKVLCPVSCRRPVTLVRTCTNPAPEGGGKDCPGQDSRVITEICRGDNCTKDKNQWTSWQIGKIGVCKLTCKRHVSLSRNCTDTEQKCKGRKVKKVFEKCRGGKCAENPTVDGQWSAWYRETIGPCQRSCKHNVTLRRKCNDPEPSGRGLDCFGESVRINQESCPCPVTKTKKTEGDVVLAMEAIIGVLAVSLVVTSVIYLKNSKRWKRIKVRRKLNAKLIDRNRY